MLVFAHHLAVLDEAQKVAVNARVGFVRIDGSTSQADRHAAVQRFQGDPQVRLAILSIKAAGQGALCPKVIVCGALRVHVCH